MLHVDAQLMQYPLFPLSHPVSSHPFSAEAFFNKHSYKLVESTT